MSGIVYRCAHCGGTFISTWTDEEARAEQSQRFPGSLEAPAVRICDDCYQMLWRPAQDVYFGLTRAAFDAERNKPASFSSGPPDSESEVPPCTASSSTRLRPIEASTAPAGEDPEPCD